MQRGEHIKWQWSDGVYYYGPLHTLGYTLAELNSCTVSVPRLDYLNKLLREEAAKLSHVQPVGHC